MKEDLVSLLWTMSNECERGLFSLVGESKACSSPTTSNVVHELEHAFRNTRACSCLGQQIQLVPIEYFQVKTEEGHKKYIRYRNLKAE